MRQEIERKFLVDSISEHRKDIVSVKRIEQTYISYEPEVRLRKVIPNFESEKEYYTLTVKSNGDISRNEYEIVISKSTYNDLLEDKLCTIVKDRTDINKEGVILHIDNFIKANENPLDFSVAEIEFESLTQAENFIKPSWLGKEVTYDLYYKNKNIAKLSQETEEGVI